MNVLYLLEKYVFRTEAYRTHHVCSPGAALLDFQSDQNLIDSRNQAQFSIGATGAFLGFFLRAFNLSAVPGARVKPASLAQSSGAVLCRGVPPPQAEPAITEEYRL